MKFSLIFGFVFVLAVQSACSASFGYANQAKWYDDFNQCSYKRQSPIELITSEAKISYDLPKLYFHNYDMLYPVNVKVENNGHTVNIDLPKVEPATSSLGQKIINQILPQIYGGPLHGDRFIAESLHFHWGSNDFHGSEHVIDSTRYTMEMHLLHRNSKYATVEEAREHADGLAVIAFLFQANETNYDYYGLSSLIEVLDKVQEYNTTAEVESFFNLATLVGDQLDADNYSPMKDL
uniref:Carbonic anhydrase n=1 Tax=Megaselia scalaris TaxID=36166 RepID=T1GY48_MEGSC